MVDPSTDLLGVVVELERLRLRVVRLGQQVAVLQHLFGWVGQF